MNALPPPVSDERTTRTGSWAVEIILLLAVLGTANILFFPGDLGFTAAVPHPLWLVILPVAARYGFVPGLTAGICCAAVHFGLTVHAIPDPTWTDLKGFSVWKAPFFFIFVGAVLGQIREFQKERYTDLRFRHQELLRTARAQEERCTLLLRAKEELDLRIITQEQSLSTLYDTARALQRLEEQAILPALLDLLREHVHIRQAAAYRLTETGLTLAARIGSEEGTPQTLPADIAPMSTVLGERRTWTVRDEPEHVEAGPQFLIMAPILAADQKTVLGLLAVRDLPFEKFTPSGIKVVSLLADWGGTSLDNARRFSLIKEQLITDESGQAFTYSYFQSRIAEEINRGRRYASVFSIIYIELAPPDDPSSATAALQSAIFLIARNLRAVDIVFHSARPGGVLVMLPATDNAGAEHTAEKLLQSLDDLEDMTLTARTKKGDPMAGIATFSPQCDTARALLETAVKDLQSSGRSLRRESGKKLPAGPETEKHGGRHVP